MKLVNGFIEIWNRLCVFRLAALFPWTYVLSNDICSEAREVSFDCLSGLAARLLARLPRRLAILLP